MGDCPLGDKFIRERPVDPRVAALAPAGFELARGALRATGREHPRACGPHAPLSNDRGALTPAQALQSSALLTASWMTVSAEVTVPAPKK